MCEKESTGQNIEMNNKYNSITIMGRNTFFCLVTFWWKKFNYKNFNFLSVHAGWRKILDEQCWNIDGWSKESVAQLQC